MVVNRRYISQRAQTNKLNQLGSAVTLNKHILDYDRTMYLALIYIIKFCSVGLGKGPGRQVSDALKSRHRFVYLPPPVNMQP